MAVRCPPTALRTTSHNRGMVLLVATSGTMTHARGIGGVAQAAPVAVEEEEQANPVGPVVTVRGPLPVPVNPRPIGPVVTVVTVSPPPVGVRFHLMATSAAAVEPV